MAEHKLTDSHVSAIKCSKNANLSPTFSGKTFPRLEEAVVPATGDVTVLAVPAHALELRVVGDGDLLAEVDEHRVTLTQCFL